MIVFWFLFIHKMHKNTYYAVMFRKENMLKDSDKYCCESI